MDTKTYNFTFEIKDEIPLTEKQLEMLRVRFANTISSYILARRKSASAIIGKIRETVVVKSEQF